MLVIRRRAGETLVIGDDVEIDVLEVAGNQVKLGIRAPRAITVMRKEVLLTADENRAAAVAPSAVQLASLARNLRPPASE